MTFPIALESYESTRSGDLLINRRVVLNQIEANNFIAIYSGKIIKTKPLTDDENADPDNNLLNL